MSEFSIRVENLTRRYGALVAVRDVSFSVRRGEIVGFLGPNGAGKSTTMRILSGIMTATSGSAWICGIPVAEQPLAAKRKIGYMPENNPLPVDMRVEEYLRFRAKLKDVPGREVRTTVEEAMEICDLARTARRKVIGTLSKGFRQRVGIADALLGKPEVIIMDEPTIGLDPHQIQGIRKLIDGLRGKMTVILSSHILPEIERSCDRVIIINRGHIVAAGTSAELRREFLPAHRYHVRLLGNEAAVNGYLASVKDLNLEPEPLESTSDPDHRLVLVGEGADHGVELIRRGQSVAGLTLTACYPEEPNLEAIFLAATKRSWEQSVMAAPAQPLAAAEV